MINNPHNAGPRRAEPLETWRRVQADTDPAVADSHVLDCARRLLADPGDESAHIWVAGLAEMVPYLVGQPGPEAERVAVEALSAAASAFGGRSCAHETHPYERDLANLSEDDPTWSGLPAGYLLADPLPTAPPEQPHDDTELCPVNLAGIARVTADTVRPFSTDGIPAVVPEDHTSTVKSLSSILWDYPYSDPAAELESNANCVDWLATRAARAGYIITQRASCWYAIHRITERSVFEAMIEGLETVLPRLGDPAVCTHGADEHPDAEFESADLAEIGFHLRSPGGRAELRETLGPYPPDAWLCPRHLRGLAEQALGELRTAHTSKFGVRDTSAMDVTYVRPDGTLDIVALTRCVADADTFAEGAENIALWAARRHATTHDRHEQLVLLLMALWVAQVRDLPYGVGREVRALLRAVDPAPLEADCPHGDDHPDGRDRRWNELDFAAHLQHLYLARTFPAPEGARPTDVWGCPRFLADWARELILELDEEYQSMDEEDGDEESVFSGEW